MGNNFFVTTQMTNKTELSDEWVDVLETLYSNPASCKNKTILITTFQPILVWKDGKKANKQLKFCTAIQKWNHGKNITVSNVTVVQEGKYQINFKENHWNKLIEIVNYIGNLDTPNVSWQDKYKKFLKETSRMNKSKEDKNTKIKNVNSQTAHGQFISDFRGNDAVGVNAINVNSSKPTSNKQQNHPGLIHGYPSSPQPMHNSQNYLQHQIYYNVTSPYHPPPSPVQMSQSSDQGFNSNSVNLNDFSQTLSSSTQPTYDLSKKRKFEHPNVEQTLKKQKSNQHSVLIRIDRITSHFSEKTLKDGQGICLNDSEEICVLDNGNGICFYNENLENLDNDIMPDTLRDNCGTSLFFDKNQFILCVPKSQILLLCKKGSELSYEDKFPNLVSVCVHNSYTFVLGSDYLAIKIPNFKVLELCRKPNVAFSDFKIIGESIFILDSFNGIIHQYYFGVHLYEESLKIVKINYYPETTLKNPQGICSYVGNTILVSQADKQVITQFKFTSNNDLEFIQEISTKDYKPNKLISKNNFIYSTTFKQTPAKIQPEPPVPLHVDPNQSFDGDNQHLDYSLLELLSQDDTTQPGTDSNFTQQTFEFLKNSLLNNMLTSHLLTHLSDTQYKHKLFRKFLVNFVDKLSANQIHSIKRFQIFDIFEFLINYQFIWHNSNSNTHFGVYLSPKKKIQMV